MLYSLVVVVLLSSGHAPAKHHKAPALHRVTFSIPYPTLYTCQEGQRIIEANQEEVGTIGARQWLPRRLSPVVAETSCVVQPTLGL